MKVFVILLILTGFILPAFGQYMGNPSDQSNDEPHFFAPAIRQTPDYHYIIPAIIVSAIIGGVVFVIRRKRK